MANELPEGAFEGRHVFVDHLRAAFGAASQKGWQEIVLSDPDFADWPLGEQAVVDALQAWAASGRTLRLLAQRFDVLERRHPRFVQWRRIWDHIVQARIVQGAHAGEVPSAMSTSGWFLHRIDPERCRGVCGAAAEQRVALRHLVDEAFHQGRPGFAASVLGL